jgi:aryl-alcohol dehydrogenase-like predicted oxidoreductase
MEDDLAERGEERSARNLLEGISFGVGTWAWGDRLFWGYGSSYAQEEVQQAFNASLEAGIRLFDTAEVYGQGQSEMLLGEFIRQARTRDPQVEVLVATKFMPFPWRLNRASLIRALRGSLRRLGLSQVDLYQIHQPMPPVNVESWMAALVEATQAGLARGVGVSNYDTSHTQRAYDALSREGIHLASNQVEYSLINRSIEKVGLLKQCHDLGVTVIAYSPLAMGVLSGKYTPENPPRGVRGGRYNRRLLQQIGPLLALMKKIGSVHAGKTPAQVALNWLICKGVLPIPGAKNLEQAEQNAGALGWRLTEDEVAALDAASDVLDIA